MTNNFSKKCQAFLLAMLFILGALPWQSAKADRLLDENFNYSPGDLYNQGGWVKYGTNAADPIQVLDGSLIYPGYSELTTGGKTELKTGIVSQQDLMHFFTEDQLITEGAFYWSFLINVKSIGDKTSQAYFANIVAQTKAGYADGGSPGEYMKLFTQASGEGFQLGVSRNGASSKANWTSETYNLNTTYLVVLKYEIVDGTTNDKMKIWVNPATDGNEPAATLSIDGTTDTTSDVTTYGIRGIELRQGYTSSNDAPNVEFDAIRCGTSWADLFDAPAAPVTNAAINFTEDYFMFEAAMVGLPFTFTTTVSGTELEDDITITCPASITASPATISKEDAMAEGGVEVTFTVTPTAPEDYYEAITFTSGDVSAMFEVGGYVLDAVKCANSVAVKNNVGDEESYFLYTGKAVVTCIETTAENTYIYAQDMFGGMKMDAAMLEWEDGCPINVGDELTNIIFALWDATEKAPVMILLDGGAQAPAYAVSATGKTKTPTEVRMADITSVTASEYLYRLITIKDVRFTGNDVTEWLAGRNLNFTDGDNTAPARIPFGSDLVGQNLPTGTVSLTGISYSGAQLTLFVRDSNDVTVGAPSLAVTPEKLMDFAADAAPVGESTPVLKLTVAAENLPQALPIELTGADAEQFAASLNEIPAGSGTYEVTVNYVPTAIGKHKANVIINADAVSAELNFTRALDGKAYDPDNLPVITITPAEVELEAAPGESVSTVVKLTGINCFDYITGKRVSTDPSHGVTVSTTFLLPDSEDAEITITFAPTEEGEYEEAFEYTTLKGNTSTLVVKALCEGARIPEDNQGEIFELDATTPLITLSEDFAAGEHNAPLRIEGWKNVVTQGTRAWWGYTFADDGTKAAKTTAYDSTLRPAKAEDAQMMLITPCLDFYNALEKKLTFELMGMYLDEAQESKLEIMVAFPGEAGAQPEFYELTGFPIPCTSDEAGKWIPFDVDMSSAGVVDPTFFIGFRLTSKRSQAEPATYYLKNVKWNPSGKSSIATIDGTKLYDVYNLQGIRVLTGADAPCVNALPAGIYVIDGRKVAVK